MKTYPEINNMTLAECRGALALTIPDKYIDAMVKPEHREEIRNRAKALRDRAARLIATQKRIAEMTEAGYDRLPGAAEDKRTTQRWAGRKARS